MKQILPIMQTLTILSIASVCVLGATAQISVTDSVSAQELQEIVIEAPKVIRKADMDVYHPSKSGNYSAIVRTC